ncbi:unnamed protein product [Sphagnum compactum]
MNPTDTTQPGYPSPLPSAAPQPPYYPQQPPAGGLPTVPPPTLEQPVYQAPQPTAAPQVIPPNQAAKPGVPARVNPNSTQNSLQIAEIRDGVVIMNDGSYRSVVMVKRLFNRKEQHVVINEEELEKAKTELRNRVQATLSGLLQCNIQGLPLDTQELIELYYDSYNPDTATRQELKNFNDLTADIITKGQGSAVQQHLQRELQ